MSIYGSSSVHGQTVETIARHVLSGEPPEGGTLDPTAPQQELGVSLTAPRVARPRADWNTLDAAALSSMSTAADPRSAVEADLAFHRILLGATHNEPLERMEAVLDGTGRQ